MTPTFLSRILPALPTGDPNFHPCYFLTAIANKRGRNIAFYDLGGPPQIIKRLNGQANLYVAPFVFSDEKAGRKIVNAHIAQSFWLDIDVGKAQNSYATLPEAATALRKFADTTGLDPNIVVFTGVGLSAWYTLTVPLGIEAWKKVAHLIALLCRQEGLVIDPACTEDPARVMRLPGSIHLKSGNTAQVIKDNGTSWDIHDLFGCIAKHYREPAPVVSVPPSTDTQAAFTEPPRADARAVACQCPQIMAAGMMSEPQWYAMMTVMKRCVNGREWAHKLSAMDGARYSQGDTDAKFDHAPEDAPARCETFQNINPAGCEVCPHRGRITSPVQLGAKAPVFVYDQPSTIEPTVKTAEDGAVHLDIPERFEYTPLAVADTQFEVTPQGIIHKTYVKGEDGNPVLVSDLISHSQIYYLYSVEDMVEDTRKMKHYFQIITPGDPEPKVSAFHVDSHAGLQQIGRWFTNAGVIPADENSNKPQLFANFMNAYLRNITKRTTLPTVKRFGWTEFEDPVAGGMQDAFVVGKGAITATGIYDVHHGDLTTKIASDELQTKGKLSEWKKVPAMYSRLDQKSAQLAMCLSFAAPLMKYCPGTATSGVFSLWSPKSGMGKTQVIRACASVWGHPDAQIIQRNSSNVLRMRKLAALHNLPCFMDELTDVPDTDLYALAYTLVDGKEKQKLRSTGDKMIATGNWKTMTFTTANKSFKAAARNVAGDSEASLLRVMEIECDFDSYANLPQTQKYIHECMAKCLQNYGLAGPEFLFQLMQNHSARLEILPRLLESWVSDRDFVSKERFIAYPLALAMTVGRWCVEFGLLDFDMDALEAWVLGTFLPHNRINTEALQLPPDKIICNFLMENAEHMLTVAAHERPAEMKEMPRGAVDKYIISFPTRNVYVRQEAENEMVYIAWSALEAWCQRRRFSAHVLFSQLRERGIYADKRSQELSAGISWAPAPPVDCLVVDSRTLNAGPGATFVRPPLFAPPETSVPQTPEEGMASVAFPDASPPVPQSPVASPETIRLAPYTEAPRTLISDVVRRFSSVPPRRSREIQAAPVAPAQGVERKTQIKPARPVELAQTLATEMRQEMTPPVQAATGIASAPVEGYDAMLEVKAPERTRVPTPPPPSAIDTFLASVPMEV